MKRVEPTKGAILTAIILAGAALALLKLLEGTRLRATTSNETPDDGTTSARVMAEHSPAELVEQRDDHIRVW